MDVTGVIFCSSMKEFVDLARFFVARSPNDEGVYVIHF
jgi:hypothetical protein